MELDLQHQPYNHSFIDKMRLVAALCTNNGMKTCILPSNAPTASDKLHWKSSLPADSLTIDRY